MASAMQANVQNFKKKLEEKLQEKNFVTDLLAKVEEKTGVKRLYIAMALSAIVALYLMIGYGAQFVCNFIGFLYPAYASVKAIETPNKEDDTQWLMYWSVYGFFCLLEFFADIFLFWIPFYWLLKCLFLLWCMSPAGWNGSDIIYNKVLRPFVLKHQKKIDATLDQAAEKIKDVKDVMQDEANDVLNDEIRRRIVDSTKSE